MVFLVHLVYQQKSLIQSCFGRRRRWCHPVSALVLVCYGFLNNKKK